MKINLRENKIQVMCNLCGEVVQSFGTLEPLSGEVAVFVEPCLRCYPPPENKAEDLE